MILASGWAPPALIFLLFLHTAIYNVALFIIGRIAYILMDCIYPTIFQTVNSIEKSLTIRGIGFSFCIFWTRSSIHRPQAQARFWSARPLNCRENERLSRSWCSSPRHTFFAGSGWPSTRFQPENISLWYNGLSFIFGVSSESQSDSLAFRSSFFSFFSSIGTG